MPHINTNKPTAQDLGKTVIVYMNYESYYGELLIARLLSMPCSHEAQIEYKDVNMCCRCAEEIITVVPVDQILGIVNYD